MLCDLLVVGDDAVDGDGVEEPVSEVVVFAFVGDAVVEGMAGTVAFDFDVEEFFDFVTVPMEAANGEGAVAVHVVVGIPLEADLFEGEAFVAAAHECVHQPDIFLQRGHDCMSFPGYRASVRRFW